jgi:hypothetical protein
MAKQRNRLFKPAVKRGEGSKLLSAILIGIGLLALLAIMWMTGRFGWSLQEDQADRYASAIIHVLVDASAAALISTASYMLSRPGTTWMWRPVGAAAACISIMLMGYSVYSWMSTRVARLEAHNRLVEAEQQALDWKRKTSISRNISKSERLYLRKETREAQEKLERSLAVIPDAPAQSIADAFNTTPPRVQRFLVIAASCVGQVIKLACLFIGFFIWPYRLDKLATRPPAGGSGGLKLVASTIAVPPVASPSPSALVAAARSVFQVAGAPDSAAVGPLQPDRRHMVMVDNDNAGPALAVGTDSGDRSVAVFTANPAASGTAMTVATDGDVSGEPATDDSPCRGPTADQVAAAAADTAKVSETWAAAADWFVTGGSPWPSVRALARHLGCHHKTAGDYVKRAERRKTSQRTDHPAVGGGTS